MKRGDNRAWVVGDVAYIDVSTKRRPFTIALIDVSDLPAVVDAGGRWQAYYNPRANRTYVVRRPGAAATRRSVYLHRFLLGLASGDPRHGDHVNRDGLDNRRRNIRAATPAQNSANARHGRGASRFKGVSRHHSGGWRAEICIRGARKHLGIFPSEQEAAREYDAAALAAHGDYALTNFGG